MAIGAFLMTSQWQALRKETAELEELATQLATERDDIESLPRSV